MSTNPRPEEPGAGEKRVDPEPTLIEWDHIDIVFKDGVDTDALFVALDPPQDVLDGRSLADIRANEDTLMSRLRAWGWGPNYDALGSNRRLRFIGCYYDYTTLEADERFMPLIAPFVAAGSLAVFHRRDGFQGHEGWEFDGTTVRRGRAESMTEWFLSGGPT